MGREGGNHPLLFLSLKMSCGRRQKGEGQPSRALCGLPGPLGLSLGSARSRLPRACLCSPDTCLSLCFQHPHLPPAGLCAPTPIQPVPAPPPQLRGAWRHLPPFTPQSLSTQLIGHAVPTRPLNSRNQGILSPREARQPGAWATPPTLPCVPDRLSLRCPLSHSLWEVI